MLPEFLYFGFLDPPNVHIQRESRPLLPLHRPCGKKLSGPCELHGLDEGRYPSDNKDSNVVELDRSTHGSCRCQISHPALIPILVDLVEHQAGGGETSFNDTTTGCNQGSWFRCRKRIVTPSARRQRWRGAAADARVDLGGCRTSVVR